MGSCKRITLKKYTDRPSPPYHANDSKGKTLEGNDGAMYISIGDKRGVYMWKRIGSLWSVLWNESRAKRQYLKTC